MQSYFQQELLLRQNSFWRIHPRRSYIHTTLCVEWVNVTTISNQVLLRVSLSLGACVDSAASGYGFSSFPSCRSPWPGFHLSNRVDERTTILAGIGKIQPLPSIRSRKFFFFFDRSFAIFFRLYLSFFVALAPSVFLGRVRGHRNPSIERWRAARYRGGGGDPGRGCSHCLFSAPAYIPQCSSILLYSTCFPWLLPSTSILLAAPTPIA